MLIKNYGLFWEMDKVNWGQRGYGNKGSLEGRWKDGLDWVVDFRDQIGVYTLYTKDFNMVYVGQTGSGPGSSLLKRLNHHQTDHLRGRWGLFSWFGLRGVVENETHLEDPPESIQAELNISLNHLEALVIAAAEPSRNLQRGRFGADVEEYIQ